MAKDERLSNSEFIELIPHLPLQDLLLVEFKITKWAPFVQVKDSTKRLYGCHVCNVVQCGVKNLYAHVDGKKHKLKMKLVKQLYHPEYTYPKTEVKQAQNLANKSSVSTNKPAPIASSSKQFVNKNVQKRNISNTSLLNNSVLEKEVSSVSDCKPPDCKNELEQKTESTGESKIITASNGTQNKTQIPKGTTVNKTTNSRTLNNGSNTAKPCPLKVKNKISKPVSVATKVQANSKVSSENISVSVDNSQNIVEGRDSGNTVNEECTEDRSTAKEETTEDSIEEENIDKSYDDDKLNSNEKDEVDSSTKQETDKNAIDPVVIVIDDDVSDNSKQTDEEPPTKKAKIVINPAAVSREKNSFENTKKTSEEVNVEKPKYQTNVIIIPTALKNKNDQAIKANVRTLPKFTTKTFSCNPLDDAIHGLIGVEYVIKIQNNRNDTRPRYECSLCELILDGSSMQNHLVGYTHRLKFCEKHFPTAIRQYRQYMRNIPEHDIFKVMTPVLAKLAVAIEQHHGRELPYECLERDFNLNRHEILSKVFSCRHASEQYGPTFTHIVDSKEIDILIANRSSYKPEITSKNITFDCRSGSRRRNSPPEYKRQRIIPTAGHYGLPNPNFTHSQFGMNCNTNVVNPQMDDETHKMMVEDFLRNTKRSKPSSRLRSRSRSNSPFRKTNLSRPTQNNYNPKRKSLSPLRQNDIWQAYRHLVDQKVAELDDVFKLYRKDPEMHPSYNDEWEMFWKRRKEELVAAGLDHRTYNYQPEWVRFFNIRIEELYNQGVENVKIESRRRLCLPMKNYELTDPKYHVHVNENVNININSVGGGMLVATKQLETSFKEQSKPEVVSVLRLLTALEEYLGSLGPKIIDLLSKALQVEKTYPDKINTMILTNETCSVLETAMEKFKGLIIAGLLEGSKERALKKAIENIEFLLSYVTSKKDLPIKKNELNLSQNKSNFTYGEQMSHVAHIKPTSSNTIPSKAKTEEISNNKKLLSNILGQVDKKELAAKLAALLTSQGKTDVDPEQLQKILSVYMLIEKKKRETPLGCNSTGLSISSENEKTLRNTLSSLINSSENKSTGFFQNNSTSGMNPTNQGALSSDRYGNNIWRGLSQSNKNLNTASTQNSGQNFMGFASKVSTATTQNSRGQNFTDFASNVGTATTQNNRGQNFTGFSGNCMNVSSNSFQSNLGRNYGTNASGNFSNTAPSNSYTLGNGYANLLNVAQQRQDNCFTTGNQQIGSRQQNNNQPSLNWNYNSTELSRGGVSSRQPEAAIDAGRKMWSGNIWRKP